MCYPRWSWRADEAAVGERIHKLSEALQDILRGVATLGELSARTTDTILATGELLSSGMVHAAFRARGIDSVLVDSRRCMVTDAATRERLHCFDRDGGPLAARSGTAVAGKSNVR